MYNNKESNQKKYEKNRSKKNQNNRINKVLVIGSGPIVIGQAAEFDYAGAQACRVLKEEGVEVVLVNSNPATIMTDKALADEIYLEPLTVETVKRIIEKEKPDSMLAGLGGQTGLTLAMKLAKEGYLDEKGVTLLGTSAEAIDKAEDRQLFKETMQKLSQPCIPSDIANDIEKAKEIAEKIGFPVIVRPAFTLGGAGGGVAENMDELVAIATNGLKLSPITQILVEKFIFGWKEIEFEVMRDSAGTTIAVCSMENFDPVGVHTGDSIVVAPAVTLSNKEYQMLRTAALDIISELEIEGGCNVQFALDPNSFDYAVIEVNPRVSRSSALASKATGYPIAKVTTKIALGYTLDEIKNDVTGKTYACFEPALDYLVVKFPKWPFDKFQTVSRQLGTQMKATGEVMSIAPNFEMALMKAVRGAEISLDTLEMAKLESVDIEEKLKDIDDNRLFTIFKALKDGIDLEKIHSITRIDRWFLNKIKNIVNYHKELEAGTADYEKGKYLGYTDKAIDRISNGAVKGSKTPVYKIVDTCAAEFLAETPYFYSSYDEECEALPMIKGEKERIIILGSGPIRIGQGIEFDYSSVHCVWALKKLGYEVIIINNNPETVSTDFDTADRLYFEPLTEEDVMNIINIEKPYGVVVAFGGQTAIKLTKFLYNKGINILGTSAESIDLAEDRGRFDELLETYGIKRPSGLTAMTTQEALDAANTLKYPVLLRPSYVIGGQNMVIAHREEDVVRYMEIITSGEMENPVLIDKYMLGKEIEVDVICDGKDVFIPGVMEHIERAGVHSGDSIAIYPTFSLSDIIMKKVIDSSIKLALSLKTKGLVNIQYLVYENELYVIEVNPRASRTIPYISKVTGVPMVDIAARVMVGQTLEEQGYGTWLHKSVPYFAVKVPVFSFEKLMDANASLGPEMKSTGEVLGLGRSLNEALFKGLVAAGFKITNKGGVFISAGDQDKAEVVKIAKKLDDLGFKIYATRGTAVEIQTLGIDATILGKMNDNDDIMNHLSSGKISYVIYTGVSGKHSISNYLKLNRHCLHLSIPCITSVDTANAIADIIASRFNLQNTELVDINNLRTHKQKLKFSKYTASGSDHIIFENFNNEIPCPESISITYSDRIFGIGGEGLCIIGKSDIADAHMRVLNKDGSESFMAGNGIRCVAKHLFEKGLVHKKRMTIETFSGVYLINLHLYDNQVKWVTVNMGKAIFPIDDIQNKVLDFDGDEFEVTMIDMGNPHCTTLCKRVDSIDMERIGPKIEYSKHFNTRVSADFVRVVNKNMLKIRSWEKGTGEATSCGTGACAAVVLATENGFCKKGEDITVKVKHGSDLIVNYTDEKILLTGDAMLVFEGEINL